MARKLKVKTLKGYKETFNVEQNETFELFVEKITKSMNLDNNKYPVFLANGKKINNENFNTILDNTTLLCMIRTNYKNDVDLKKYSFKQVLASMIVFLQFTRNNPDIHEMYENDFKQLVYELSENEGLKNVIKSILDQSEIIINARNKNENITVDLSSGGMDKIELTKADDQVLDEIINMGFDENLVVVTYLKSGKNKDITISELLGNK